MSAIACFVADKGHQVIGSDRSFDANPEHLIKKILLSKGISILPQDGSGIDKTLDLVVFSTAVEKDTIEYQNSVKLKLQISTRPEYLSEIVLNYNTIAVAGTSGKSTSSGMLAFLMKKLGLNPNFIGGGRVIDFKTDNNPGNSLSGNSDYLVIEACESDGTIINYKPLHSIILNLAFDHHSIEKSFNLFKALVENTKDMVILNADDPNLKGLTNRKKVITFSINKPSDYRAENITYNKFNSEFFLKGTRFNLSLPGKYNIYNALSSIAFLNTIGFSLKDISSVIGGFRGVERRFQIHLYDEKRLVIDDYAHNPHKISSLMNTVKKIRKNICYIFQPHGFGPTKMMKDEYIEVFTKNLRASDQLILLPIFYAGGNVSKEISSLDIADGIRKKSKNVKVIERNEILKEIDNWNNYIIFGARDDTLSDLAKEISNKLKNSIL